MNEAQYFEQFSGEVKPPYLEYKDGHWYANEEIPECTSARATRWTMDNSLWYLIGLYKDGVEVELYTIVLNSQGDISRWRYRIGLLHRIVDVLKTRNITIEVVDPLQ